MGEAPLNTLEDPHPFRGACLSALDNESQSIQAAGWWFNRENLTLSPQTNGRISLPGDAIEVRTDSRFHVQRGRYLYNTDDGTLIFDKPVEALIIRLVPFEELPESAAQYIAACAVLYFQQNYDGDSTKMRALEQERSITYARCHAIETRNSKANLINNNERLQQLKQITRRVRALVRP